MNDIVFAPQKIGLLPEWVAWEGAADPDVEPSIKAPAQEIASDPVEEPVLTPIQASVAASGWSWASEMVMVWFAPCMGWR
jgi:hypothetical protein